ncbi:unnamed protein product [Nezara viridula]|uniref:C2H2-type domain-containing protein n=1 Tax=Nezara viridula TaxID=85310 RepID=A0A9P0MMU1_NEZVI|nr:unnamed protein product [Nezara viridula]
MDEVGASGLGVFIKVEKPDEIESTSESDSVVFIKEEKPDETDSTYLIDDDLVNEEENTEDTHACEDDSTAPQREELYHQSLQEKRIITRKRRKKALTATDRSQPFPQRRKLKNENTSCPATQSSPYENNNLSVLNHNSSTSADTTMRIPKVTIKQEKGSLFYCGGLIPEQEEATFVPEEGSEMNHIKQEEEIILSDDVPKVGVKQEEGSLFYCEGLDPLNNLQDINKCELKTKTNEDSKEMSDANFEPSRKTVLLKKHQCPHCKYKASYPSKLKIHIIACHTNEKPHHCPCCDYRATTHTILKRHIKASHMDEKPQQCPHCDFVTADIISLERHINARNTSEEPRCPRNDDGTIQSNNIEIAPHKTDNPLQCPYCEYKGAYPSKLKMHIMACHTNERPHQCPDCDYRAVKISNLKIHIMAHHTDEKPYPCAHCDYKAATFSTLKTHVRFRHTGEKPHHCPHCDYKSVTISCLKKHIMARHLGEKPFKCPHCDYKATQHSNLKTHMKYIHMSINE